MSRTPSALAGELGAAWADPAERARRGRRVRAVRSRPGVLTPEVVDELRVRAVIGAANNQLAERDVARMLRERGIAWAPDFVVNAGGVVYLDLASTPGIGKDELDRRIAGIGDVVGAVLRDADTAGITTLEAAERLARTRLDATLTGPGGPARAPCDPPRPRPGGRRAPRRRRSDRSTARPMTRPHDAPCDTSSRHSRPHALAGVGGAALDRGGRVGRGRRAHRVRRGVLGEFIGQGQNPAILGQAVPYFALAAVVLWALLCVANAAGALRTLFLALPIGITSAVLATLLAASANVLGQGVPVTGQVFSLLLGTLVGVNLVFVIAAVLAEVFVAPRVSRAVLRRNVLERSPRRVALDAHQRWASTRAS